MALFQDQKSLLIKFCQIAFWMGAVLILAPTQAFSRDTDLSRSFEPSNLDSAKIIFQTDTVEADLAFPSRPYSLMDPHKPSSQGPWFEGWYYRLTDPNKQSSIAIIVASTLDKASKVRKMSGVPGYVAVLISDGPGRPTRSFEAFPQNTRIVSRGQEIFSDRDFDPTTDFEWSAPGFGRLTHQELEIAIPGAIRVRAAFDKQKPWSLDSHLKGPGGISAFLPFVPLHWFVHSLGSQTLYEVEYKAEDGRAVAISGQAWTHQEKNWGVAFPNAWIWLQAVSANNDAQLVIAGGELALVGTKITTFLMGYRSEHAKVDFRPSQIGTFFSTTSRSRNDENGIDACTGTIELRAVNLNHEMIVRAQAPLQTFAPVSIPTKDGYKRNGGIESFSATIDVSLYRRSLLSSASPENLIEHRRFEHAALEFGANYQICNRTGANDRTQWIGHSR